MLPIPPAIAVRAADEYIAEKLHLDFLEPGPAAAFTLALSRVETESAGIQAALAGELGLREDLANVVERADIDGGI
jgi:hypothetical protein